ncbi:MAG: outer membrane lipoprotein-sorting protein [Chlorobiaceae bacterium]|nr:outer membrane lipoprotein-sorting protein [Chlorobiaceae bacterium]
MYKTFFRIVISLLLLLTVIIEQNGFAETASSDAEQNSHAEEILKQADDVRAPWSDFTMAATLSYENQSEQKKDVFRVFIKNRTKTLVSYIEPVKQRGNMLLMLNDNLWYYVNKTQRPMRITPIQKLSGAASYGDITKLSWSRDYLAAIEGEQSVMVKQQSYETWLLKLTARSKSATYHKIDLYVEKGNCYPRKAIVFLQSGKKMKTMYFTGYTKNAGKMMNTKIEFIDHLASDKLTTLAFSKVVVKKSPDGFFLQSSLPSLYSEVVY